MAEWYSSDDSSAVPIPRPDAVNQGQLRKHKINALKWFGCPTSSLTAPHLERRNQGCQLWVFGWCETLQKLMKPIMLTILFVGVRGYVRYMRIVAHVRSSQLLPSLKQDLNATWTSVIWAWRLFRVREVTQKAGAPYAGGGRGGSGGSPAETSYRIYTALDVKRVPHPVLDEPQKGLNVQNTGIFL